MWNLQWPAVKDSLLHLPVSPWSFETMNLLTWNLKVLPNNATLRHVNMSRVRSSHDMALEQQLRYYLQTAAEYEDEVGTSEKRMAARNRNSQWVGSVLRQLVFPISLKRNLKVRASKVKILPHKLLIKDYFSIVKEAHQNSLVLCIEVQWLDNVTDGFLTMFWGLLDLIEESWTRIWRLIGSTLWIGRQKVPDVQFAYRVVSRLHLPKMIFIYANLNA